MKKRIVTAVLTLAAVLAGAAPAYPVSAEGIELLNFDYDDEVRFSPTGSGKVVLNEKDGHSGARSVEVTGRTQPKDGAALDVEMAEESAVYNVTLWVKSASPQKLTAELGGKKVNSANLPANTWTKLEGSVTHEGGDAQLTVYGANGTANFMIDDVSVLAEGQIITTPYAPEGVNMLPDGDFESGGAGVFEARSCTNTVTEAAAHSGKYGMSVSGRDQDWTGIQTNIKDLLIQNANYEASAWIRIDNPEPVSAEYYLQLEIASEGGGTEYPSIIKTTAKSGEWTQVKGVFSTASFLYPMSKIILYIGSADGNTYDFMIDDFTLAYTKADESGASSRPMIADPWINREITPLKDVYKDYFLLGCARSSDSGESGRLEDEMMQYHFDIVTCGNDMKPDYLEGKKGTFTFNKADRIVDTEIANGLKMHGHVFVWHSQSPAWLTNVSSRDEGLANMKDYIYNVAEHFKGRCYSWDVVNEAIDNITDTSTVSGILRDAPWRKAIGDDYIEYAFKYAAEADPNALLYYNDYNLDEAAKADAVVTLVKDLQSKGIKIDGVGMQGHYSVNTSIKAVENSLKKFSELGVKISISELDVSCLQAGAVPTEAEYIKQAQKYAELFRLFKKYSDIIDRVTLWGIDDGTSWRASDYPCVFDLNYQPKEAYYAVLDPDKYLEQHPVTKNVINRAGSAYGTPVIDGTADEAWNNVPEYKLSRYVMAWQGASGTFKSMWDENNLYLLVDVKDPVLSAVASEAHMQDSVEAFLDENNGKTTYYEDDDAQFRVNYENVQSFGTNGSADRFKTAVRKTDGGYMAEIAISFKKPHSMGEILGFDAQINDDGAGDGNRNSVAKFNDMTDLSWGNTENWGEIELSADGTVTPTSDPDAVKVILDGEQLVFDVEPVIINDLTLVPFRALLEKLGAEVEYIEEGQYVNASRDGIDISLQIDNTEASVNGAAVTLETAPTIINDRTLVPLRFVSESLNAKVDWDEDTKTVTITTK